MCPARIVQNHEDMGNGDMGNGKECSPREILNHSLIQNCNLAHIPFTLTHWNPFPCLTAAVFRIEERQRSQKISKLDRILRREKINTFLPQNISIFGKAFFGEQPVLSRPKSM
jgi:hypothetical protein